MNLAIHWFRQDLRISDNLSLTEAAKSGEVLPIYILDDENASDNKMGEASRVWLHYALENLNKSLEGNLLVFKGDAKKILPEIISKSKAKFVFWNRCYEPWRISRDKIIKENLIKSEIEVKTFNSALLFEPWETLKENGEPYKVFTPYYKKNYFNSSPRTPIKKPEQIKFTKINIKSDTIESLNLLPKKDWYKDLIKNWNVSESAAQSRLYDFLENGIKNYQEGRNFPSTNNNSRLSPYLHFGQISPNQIWYAARFNDVDKNIENFCLELAWREFSFNLLYYFPELPSKNLQSKFDKFPWHKDNTNLKKWQKGMTGYPIVDAGMRELWQTGFMHNRVRMIVGSFLVKNLLIDWREGEKWFWDTLVDADLASNSASWQWVAGSGADAAPYFRIFNPVTQGERFDLAGKYTRKYVPELKNLPDKYLFNPWDAPADILSDAGIKLGKDYPLPIVDIQKSRKQALDAYDLIK